MSYYILPKTNNIINVNPIDSQEDILKPYISHSLYHYYNQTRNEIEKICSNESDSSNNCFDELIKIVNPYEYIFSKVPGSKFSVSKLKPKSNVFYDFLEVSTTVNIFESFKNQVVKTLHFTPNYSDTIECFEMLRENFNDDIIYYDEINEDNMKELENNKFNFLFVEVESSNFKKYVSNLIQCLMLIFKNQESGGSLVIKLNHIFHKPVVDILYILSSFLVYPYLNQFVPVMSITLATAGHLYKRPLYRIGVLGEPHMACASTGSLIQGKILSSSDRNGTTKSLKMLL